MALTLNETNFATEVLQSSQAVLVDFWAEWCGPCKMIAPMIDQLADEVAGQAKVGKVDVDSNHGLAAQYGVNSIPMLLFFKGGQVRDQVRGGGVSKEQLKAKLLAL